MSYQKLLIFIAIMLQLYRQALGVPAVCLPPANQFNSQVKSGLVQLINPTSMSCLTSNSTVSSFSATVTFSGAFGAIPRLAYGVHNYESFSNLGLVKFQVTINSLSTSGFVVQVFLRETTCLWLLKISYISISLLISGHINAFNDIPVDYGSTLTNVTAKSLSIKTYTNYISYSALALSISSPFTSFTSPLSNYIFVSFLTTLHYNGTVETLTSFMDFPIKLNIQVAPYTSTHFMVVVKFCSNAQLTKLHLSLIIYDQVEVRNYRPVGIVNEGHYFIHDRQCFTTSGGFYGDVPTRSQNNFIMGMIGFFSHKTDSVIHFQNQFISYSGSKGSFMYPSIITTNSSQSDRPLDSFCYTYFYLITWKCPTTTVQVDYTTGLCNGCGIVGCKECDDTLPICAICDASLNFFADINGLCVACNIPGCITCTSFTDCSLCDSQSNYIINGTSCILCTNNTFANPSTQSCDPCPLANCAICATYQTCFLCDITNLYFVNPYQTCTLCDWSLNYILDLTTFSCDLCTIPLCLNCSTLTTCQLCDEPNGFFVDPNDSLCYPCAPTNCITCFNLTGCSLCNQTIDYVVNPNNFQCQLCTLVGCINCSNTQVCNVCDISSNYYHLNQVNHTTCGYCDPLNNTFINLTTQNCQLCTLTHCIICDNLTYCGECNATEQYFVDPYEGDCQPCRLVGCLNCTSLITCDQCDTNNSYYFSYKSVNLTQCGDCSESCVCDGYGLPWDDTTQQCTPICGDGLLRLNQQCDDNNTIAGDGCSPSCMIEFEWFCTTNNVNLPSVCIQSLFLNAQVLSIEKYGCNSLKITTRVPYILLEDIPQTIKILNDQVYITSMEQNGTQILIYADYTKDLINEAIIVKYSAAQVISIPFNPAAIPLYYTEEQCKVQEQVETMLKSAQIISYAILIVSLLSCKIIGLELFGVLQLSYFTLSSHNFLNVYLAPLTKFKTFNGLNIGFVNDSSQLPNNIQKMDVAGNFLNNCNIMIFILYGELILSLALYLIAKKVQNVKFLKVSLRLLKQGFITLVLFNIFNIAFSAGIHWKYAAAGDQYYAVSSFFLVATLIVIVVAVFAMQLTNQEDYGQFKQKFKNVWICRLYIPLTVIYRMTLGLYSALKNDYDQGSLIIMAFALAFMMYTIINLPFTNVFQNYRCALIHLTMLYTLLTTNYYRGMKSTTPLEIKGRIYTPAIIELVLMISCIAVSFFVLAYQIYQIVKECRKKQKTSEPKNQSQAIINETQQTFDQIQ